MKLMAWPTKTRDTSNHHQDSTIWDEFVFRNDDVIIATYGKSGTTWMQQIVSQLIFNGEEALDIFAISPWLDLRTLPREETLERLAAQPHRRFIKTHLPVDALVYSRDAKYIYVGRDGRDVCWSLYNHHANANEAFYRMINDTPGRVGPELAPPTESIRDYFLTWLERDGYPFWSFWENVRGWWSIRDLPNLLLVHYADLKADLPGEIRRIAEFLDAPIDKARWPAIVEHCTFDYMKAHAASNLPMIETVLNGGARTFINKGTNGRWRDVLSVDDIHRYEREARMRLGDGCATWLATGNHRLL